MSAVSPDDATTARAWRLASIVLRSPHPDALAAFYRAAFDFVDAPATGGPTGDAVLHARTLLLGDTRLCIERCAAEAPPYPDDAPGWSPSFQHFAIRVTDVDAAYARLAAVAGWRPISTHGPQRLPPSTGSVTAFKFRDPEGHPLELLAFPGESSGPLFVRIDHSAISVADVERSIAFYERLGLAVAGRTLNSGLEQSRLDAIDDARVDVVALDTPSRRAPHVELLGYRDSHDRGPTEPAPVDDGVATRLVFEAADDDRISASRWRDPDGHAIELRRGPATPRR